ncbi:MAG: hypothetical protein DMD81_22775 [Candidatus Rokuibacteriota bacterium]|nr:MAG: hypothetical protein DMD81_22775 [Candidatus Rokubacteria bacterium]
MAFDSENFVDRFNTVWNGHDVDGILGMMTDDVIFEASFGKDPWGSRVTGKEKLREFLEETFERVPDIRWDEIRHFAALEIAVVEWLTTGTPRGGLVPEGPAVAGERDRRIIGRSFVVRDGSGLLPTRSRRNPHRRCDASGARESISGSSRHHSM